ncbi:MAG: CPBP family intramembrane metalloprotease [Ruminococcus sp.]|nr:CPBP family intramembrane metalloprotease [Ruminococcus sp.]
MNYNDKISLRKTCSSIGFMVFASAVLLHIIPYSMSIISGIFRINPLSATLEPIISCIDSIVSLFIVGAIYCKLSSSDMSKLVPVSRVKPKLLCCFVLITLTVSFISSYMTDILLDNLSFIGISSKSFVDIDSGDGFSVLLQIISVAVVPALVEEFMFRGIILHKLLPYGTTFAILVTTILFAMLHGNIVQIPFAFVGGLAMAFSVVKTNSLLPSIISHFFINLLSVYLDAAKYYEVPTDINNTIYFILLFVVVLGGVLSAFILSSNKDLFKTNLSKYKFRECMGVCFSSVGIIFTGIFLIIRTVNYTL